MGAVAITSQKQPAGSSGELTTMTVERIDFTRQQEIQCMKDYYETRIRICRIRIRRRRGPLNKKIRN